MQLVALVLALVIAPAEAGAWCKPSLAIGLDVPSSVFLAVACEFTDFPPAMLAKMVPDFSGEMVVGLAR